MYLWIERKIYKGQISLFDGFQMGEETIEVEQEVNSIPKLRNLKKEKDLV